jgi:hypothetical protein
MQDGAKVRDGEGFVVSPVQKAGITSSLNIPLSQIGVQKEIDGYQQRTENLKGKIAEEESKIKATINRVFGIEEE